ncbi:hypothetical protein GIB67_027411 [Kingdonia uniflora]|uniref:Uncharacterized protein n=1 Tax=Kingdonia uniflora TaxID=39325 RepID=A0A7J7MFK6_9MAGN|nr:hypothetical protein GIB67_027411 [Kingdonia uniflora]
MMGDQHSSSQSFTFATSPLLSETLPSSASSMIFSGCSFDTTKGTIRSGRSCVKVRRDRISKSDNPIIPICLSSPPPSMASAFAPLFTDDLFQHASSIAPQGEVKGMAKDAELTPFGDKANIDSQAAEKVPILDNSETVRDLQAEVMNNSSSGIKIEVVSPTVVSQTHSLANGVAISIVVPPVSLENIHEGEKETKDFKVTDERTSVTSSNSSSSGSLISKGSPHFRPLQCYSEMLKKNLISGWDRTFEETVNRIQSLQSIEYWASVNELSKTLSELENMGYNIDVLKKRLDDLNALIMKRNSSRFTISGLNMEKEGHEKEKKRLENDIYKMLALIEKEQASINELNDKVKILEEELPTYDGLFATLAMAPL